MTMPLNSTNTYHIWFDRVTNNVTFFVFDNKLVKQTVGLSALSYSLILLLAVSSIKLGSHATIERPKNALPPSDDHPLFDPSDKDREIYTNDEKIDLKMVVFLPIFAGLTLSLLYFLIKNNSKETFMYIMSYYIVFMSFGSVKYVVSYIYTNFIREHCYEHNLDSIKWNGRFTVTLSKDDTIHPLGFEHELLFMPDHTEEETILKQEKLDEIRSPIKVPNQYFNFYFSTADIIGLCIGLIFAAAFYLFNGLHNWILNNILGFCAVVVGISKTKVPNFSTAILLLTLFFFYDIYFVFASDVMVTVATQITLPAKLLAPHTVDKLKDVIKYTLLGLGDLVLPGIFISLCLRFDLFLFHKQNARYEFHLLQNFEKTYFNAAIIGYIVGLIITFVISSKFKTGQPALLYLFPSTIFSVLVMATFKNDLVELWNYDESIDEKEVKTEKAKNCERLSIICSKETLFLSGKIAEDDDYDEEGDVDYQYLSEDDDDLESGNENESDMEIETERND